MTLKKKLIHYLIHTSIVLTLIIGWLLFSLYFTSRFSFSVITSSYNSNNFTNLRTSEIHKGQKASAEFTAKENNLGIISVRFNTYNRINDDVVKFRLKEKNTDKWFYEHIYKVDQFQPDDYFTFGFPIISNSQNKTYIFEIESTKGSGGDAVAISKINPTFTAQYQYTKQELLSNKIMLPEFLFKKIYYSFSDINFVVSSLVYLLPLIFYLTWYYLSSPIISITEKHIFKISIKSRNPLPRYANNYLLIYLYISTLLFITFFLGETRGYIDLMLIILWILLIWLYRFESNVSFLFALLFLLLCPFMLILKNELAAENSARLAYFLLVIGTVSTMVEIKMRNKNLVTYNKFLTNVRKTLKLKKLGKKIGF